MLTYSQSIIIHEALPKEYRDIAELLFPSDRFSNVSIGKAALAFADILGVSSDYKRILNAENGELRAFLNLFQKNFDLLIQKTWVEQSEKEYKEELQDKIPGFIANIEAGNYKKTLVDFSIILEELSYLLFGAQSRKNDFTEYTFRIDEQMGLFWYYGQQLKNFQHHFDSEDYCDETSLKAILFLGICYLTNF